MTKRDWTLLVIDAAKPRSLTPIQLQKSLFLFGQNVPQAVQPNFYQFIPYNFGPFSRAIYIDAEMLAGEGLIEMVAVPGQQWCQYSISPMGTRRSEKLREVLPPHVCEYLDKLVAWVASQSLQELLRSVYQAYPDFAKNSVFQH
jgi:hypothetical protein